MCIANNLIDIKIVLVIGRKVFFEETTLRGFFQTFLIQNLQYIAMLLYIFNVINMYN